MLAWNLFSVVALLSVPVVRGLAFYDITFIFSFGDSYTADGYQPALGYSPVTGQTSTTTSGGLNWLQFLAHVDPDTANSFYDFATQGATVTNAIVNTGVSCFVDQVTTFEKYFVQPANPPPWKSHASTSLFSVWFGIVSVFSRLPGLAYGLAPRPRRSAFTFLFPQNDIGYSYLHGQIFPAIIDSIFDTYDAQIQRLYADGARNFLINNVPPTDKAPLVATYGAATVLLFEANVALWNRRIAAYVVSFSSKYPSATATLFDAHNVFNTILANSSSYKIADTTTVCSSYSTITDQPFLYLPFCQWPLQAYFWHNTYHPTWPVHQALADSIVMTLSASSAPTKRMRKRSGHRLDDLH